jgi:hypothetical protein
MEKSEQKGGKREGAGRKPSESPKTPLTIYVPIVDIEYLGGRDKVRELLITHIENLKALKILMNNEEA